MDLFSVGLWRYPKADAQRFGDDWWVVLPGQATLALPEGVMRDYEDDNEPELLDVTLHEVRSDLDMLESLDNEEQAAAHAAVHCRRFGTPDLCGPHGLPVWHDPPRARPGGAPRTRVVSPSCIYGEAPDGHLGLKVAAVVNFVKHLRGLEQIADHLTLRQDPTPAWMIDEVLNGDFIEPQYVRRVRGLQQANEFTRNETRRLLTHAVDRAMASSRLVATVRWPEERRPELALVADTACALYVADLLAHVGSTDPDRTYLCSVCGQPYTPRRRLKPNEGRYCTRPECRNERNRMKQVRRRAREGATDGEHHEET